MRKKSMNKIQVTWFFLLVMVFTVKGQTWHNIIPTYNVYPYGKILPTGDHFLLTWENKILEMDASGELVSLFEPKNNFGLSSLIMECPGTSTERQFLVANRNPNPPGYNIALYQAGDAKYKKERFFPETSGSLSFGGPVFLAVSNTEIMVFGKTNIRKIKYEVQYDSIVELFSTPNSMGFVTAATATPTGFVCADNEGKIIGLTGTGVQNWVQQQHFFFRGLLDTGDGLLACGSIDSVAAVLKLNYEGQEIWRKTYPFAEFYTLSAAHKGGFVVGGKSNDEQAALVKISTNGDLLWENTYPSARFISSITAVPSGGYCMIAYAKLSNGSIQVIRTDASGIAPAPSVKSFGPIAIESPNLRYEALPIAAFILEDNDKIGIRVPKDSSQMSYHTSSIWLGGKDQSGNLHTSINTYGPNASDFIFGLSSEHPNDFDQVWKINRSDIEAMRKDFIENGQITKPIPYHILSWPGKGNPNFKQNRNFGKVTTHPLDFPAPFIDNNQDGIYNVFDGDFPDIKGDYMVWWVMHDDTNHKKSYGYKFPATVAFSVYLFACNTSELIQNTLFVDIAITNQHPTEIFKDTYFGIFSDPQVGCYTDDYVGTIPSQNSIFVYNQDEVDNICPWSKSFVTSMPVLTTTLLNKPINYSMYYNFSQSTPAFFPSDAIGYYRFLTGHWNNGTPLTYGGSGNDPNGQTTNFFFPGNPAIQSEWSMCSEILPIYDKKTVFSHGPFDFLPNVPVSFSLAYTFHDNIQHPCPDITQKVGEQLNLLQKVYDQEGIAPVNELQPIMMVPAGQSIQIDPGNSGNAWQWSDGNTTQTIQALSPGTYTVTITGSTGCSSIATIQLQDPPGMADNPNTAFEWRISPNPARQSFTIQIPSKTPENYSMEIWTSDGRLVFETFLAGGENSIERKGLSLGLYWVVVKDEQGVVKGKKALVFN
jgi:hypothetical protein